MGQLAYGIDGHHYEVDDTTLRHLRAAIIAKLRRQEPFALTLRGPGTDGAAETLWVQPSIPLRFVFDTEDSGQLDRERLKALAARHIHPDQLIVLVVGDRERVLPGLAALEIGPVVELDPDGSSVE